MSQATSGNPSIPITVTCACCGKVHQFSQFAAVESVWCDGCGELIESQGRSRRPAAVQSLLERRHLAAPIPGAILNQLPGKKSRPISVHVVLIAGGLAVFMEFLAALASAAATGMAFLSFPILMHPWWLFLFVWLGLMAGSQRAARSATVGGVFFAFLVCNFALRQQIAMWGTNPAWSDLIWGTLRVMFRSLPLLVMVVALGTRSARDYFQPAIAD